MLRDPAALPTLSAREASLVVRQARAALLAARLALALQRLGLLETVPAEIRRHLVAARTVAARHRQAVRWEARCIVRALEPLGLPAVFLKGAAYALVDAAPAASRIFSDVDVLVPPEALADVERQLGLHGWVSGHHDAYDQRYYRQWMHELPPLRHARRGTVLDVHHALVPPTARVQVDATPFRADARPVEGLPGALCPRPEDLVLHAAAHLFYDGEPMYGLRDLSDLDLLLRAHDAAPFWTTLEARATSPGLGLPLWLALDAARRLFGTPVPDQVLAGLAPLAPPRLLRPLIHTVLARTLLPWHDTARPPGTALARLLVYVRGHWLRMPLHLLLPHLLRKALRPAR